MSFIALVLAASASPAAQSPADSDQGQRIFDGSCARCHGFDGFGATGPNLQRSEITKPGSEPALQAIVINGIPARGMPPTSGLSDGETRALIAYVQKLRGADEKEWSTRAARGRDIYNKLDCNSCHVVQGQGRSAGPELTRIGIKRKVDELRQDLTAPAASLPRAGSVFEYLPVRVVTQEGREITGTRLNEDAFSIQLRDEQGQLHTFRKSQLTQIDKHYDRSSMPSYRFSDTELDDLVAYLSSLRGAP